MTATLKKPRATKADREAERLAERDRVKEFIADREVTLQRARLIENEIRGLDARCDEAVQRHQSTCRPAQNRVAEIERGIKAAILKRKPVGAELESERIELLHTITTANAELERETSLVNKVRANLERDKRKLLTEAADITPLRNRLANELGNPRVLLEKFCAEQTVKWLGQRLNAARAQLATARAQVEKIKGIEREPEPVRTFNSGITFTRKNQQLSAYDAEQLANQTRRAERWQAECSAAAAALAAASAEAERVQTLLIDE
jgi:hypothetical protein